MNGRTELLEKCNSRSQYYIVLRKVLVDYIKWYKYFNINKYYI